MINNQKLNVENYFETYYNRYQEERSAYLLKNICRKIQRSAESSLRRTSQRRNIPAPNQPAPKHPCAESSQRRIGRRRNSPAPNGVSAETAAPNSPSAETAAPNRSRRIGRAE